MLFSDHSRAFPQLLLPVYQNVTCCHRRPIVALSIQHRHTSTLPLPSYSQDGCLLLRETASLQQTSTSICQLPTKHVYHTAMRPTRK